MTEQNEPEEKSVEARMKNPAMVLPDAMAGIQNLTHTGSGASSPGDRMKAAGYDVSGGWAENIARGYTTADAVMQGWMGSTGHRANILNCSLKAIGVGVARSKDGQLYWTQDFGAR